MSSMAVMPPMLDLYGPTDPGSTAPTDYGSTNVVDESGDPTVAQDVLTDEQTLTTDAAAGDQATIAALNASLTQQENSVDQTVENKWDASNSPWER